MPQRKFYLDRIYVKRLDDQNRAQLFVEVNQDDLKKHIFDPLYDLKQYKYKFFSNRYVILGDFRIGKTELMYYISNKILSQFPDCISVIINSQRAQYKNVDDIDNWIYDQWLAKLIQIENSSFQKVVQKILHDFKEERGQHYKKGDYLDKVHLICTIYQEYANRKSGAKFIVGFDQANVIDQKEAFTPFYEFWRNFQGYWEDPQLFANLKIFIFVVGHKNWEKFATLKDPSGQGIFDIKLHYDYWTSEDIYQLFEKRLRYAIKSEYKIDLIKYFLPKGLIEFFGNKLGKLNTAEYLKTYFGPKGYLQEFLENFPSNGRKYNNFLEFCKKRHRKSEYDETYFYDVEKIFIKTPSTDFSRAFKYLSTSQNENWYNDFFKLVKVLYEKKNKMISYSSKEFNKFKNIDKDHLSEYFCYDKDKGLSPVYNPPIFEEFLKHSTKYICLNIGFSNSLDAIGTKPVLRLKRYIESLRIKHGSFSENKHGKEMKKLLESDEHLARDIFNLVQEWTIKDYVGVIGNMKPITNDHLLPFYNIRNKIINLRHYYTGNTTNWAEFDAEARTLGNLIIKDLFPGGSPILNYLTKLQEYERKLNMPQTSNIKINRILNEILATLMEKLKLFDSVIGSKNQKLRSKKKKISLDKSEREEETRIHSKNDINVFISCTLEDQDTFSLNYIIEYLEKQKRIHTINWCEKDQYDNFIDYMDDCVGKCDIMLLFCSPKAKSSKHVKKEWNAVESHDKPILPVYTKKSYIPPLLRSREGCEIKDIFKKDEIADEIYKLILKKIG